MQIRKALPQDAKALHQAHMRSIQEVCSKDHTESEISGWGHRAFDERKWVGAITNQQVWVIEQGGAIFGYGHIFQTPEPKTAYIYGLYLTPEALGQGLGRKLVGLMLDWARSKEFTLVKLDSTLTAHGFYKHMGFTDSGPLCTHEIGGSMVRCYPMSLRL